MNTPSRETARNFAQGILKALPTKDRKIRLRVCEIVEHCALATADREDLETLRAAAYLQEVGVVSSSTQKEIYSLELVCHGFADGEGTDALAPPLVDCIRTHARDVDAATEEGRLMQICYKYVKTHYQDYMLLKNAISPEGFERLQMERIEAYSRHLEAHPRGNAINSILQSIFLLETSLDKQEGAAGWARELAILNASHPFSTIHGHRLSA